MRIKLTIVSSLIIALLAQSTLAFVPTSNYELDLNVIETRCLEFGDLDILDQTNERALCEIVTSSPACENIEAERKRQCDPSLIVDTNAGVEFISCLKGLWGSAVEFMKFIGSVIEYAIDSETRQEKNEELVNTMESAKHFLAMEWSRSLSETDGWGPIHYMNAAKHFSGTMGKVIYNMLEEMYFSMQENYACLNPAARTQALCQFAGSVLIPPAIVMAKVAKFLINRGRTISSISKRADNAHNEELDSTLLSKNELDDNKSEFNNYDEETANTTMPFKHEANLLSRLELTYARRVEQNPKDINRLSNNAVSVIEGVTRKLGIPTRKDTITIDGKNSDRLVVTKDDLLKSSTPAAKQLLKLLEESKLSNLIIAPEAMMRMKKVLYRSEKGPENMFLSAKGLQSALLKIGNEKRQSLPTTPYLQRAMKSPGDKEIEVLASKLNEEGFAVRVITLKRKVKDEKTNEEREIRTKALQFNQYAADRNHPGVLKLQRFRNDDFRQKILFYPDTYVGAAGQSNRGTRAVSFNFSNLDELLQGHHQNTVPHEFRHAKFEYNRSKGRESVYDLRVKHAKEDGKLHDGKAYTNYFSMEEVYNHSQDIYHVARSITRNADPESALKQISGKTNVISSITRGFRAQNDSLNMNMAFDIESAPLKFPEKNKGFTVQIGNDSAITAIKDNNGYYSVVVKDADVYHTIPMVSPESQQVLNRFINQTIAAKSKNDFNGLRQELKTIFGHVKEKNEKRRDLLNKLEPKAKELRELIASGDINDLKIAQIKELSRQIAQISKGRAP